MRHFRAAAGLGSAWFCSVMLLHANPILVNPGFETGDLSGWTSTNLAQVTVTGATSVTANTGIVWNVAPNGSQMAEIVGESTTAADLDTFFGLPDGTLEAQVPGASFGDGIQQTVTGLAGDELIMSWALVETDYPPFNDTVFAVVNQGSTNVVFDALGCITGGCDHVVGIGGSQPWTAFSYTLPADGTYTIGFGAVNTSDATLTPSLFLDDAAGGFIAVVPEPKTTGSAAFGLLVLVSWGLKRRAA